MSKNRQKNTLPLPDEEDPPSAQVVAMPKAQDPEEANPEQEIEVRDALPDARKEPKPVRLKPRSDRIGDLLREARLERNDDLYLIAEYLCIKPAFLIALENSRYDEFPADAYVIGFLRTYATFLGIDGKEAVDRYRYEMAGRRKKPILSMPIPVSEGRTPSGFVMLGAAFALILIYTLWYSISSADRTNVHTPTPMPTAMQPVPDASDSEISSAAGLTAPVSQVPPASTSRADSPPLQSTPDKPAESVSAQTSVVIPPAYPGIIVTAEKQPSSTSSKEDFFEKSANAPKMEKKVDVKTEVKAEVKPEVKAEVKQEIKAEQKTEIKAEVKPETKEIKTETADKKQEASPPAAGSSHVVIRATQSSWVMVVDSAGNAVFDRVLKVGETYNVPAKPGLSLTTGNGGGIVLSVDGNDLSKISDDGPHVVRDIALDPNRLVAKYGR
jgi:cytoskeleton protein RodZ